MLIEKTVRELVGRARAEGRSALLEREGLALAESLGVRAPRHVFLKGASELAALDLDQLPGRRVVIKVVSRGISHKSDVGGVVIVAKRREEIESAILTMQQRFAGQDVHGYTLNEFVEHERAFGSELLLGLRSTPDFGSVVTLAPGGVHAEFLTARLKAGADIAILSPDLPPADPLGALQQKAVVPIVTGGLRGQAPLLEPAALATLLQSFLELAAVSEAAGLGEFEINPLVLTPEGPVALDALGRLAVERAPTAPARPLEKLGRLLTPTSVAVVGVSEKLNPGHVILNNLIREGFDRDRIFVIKPGRDLIEGCRCVESLEALPEPVDLLVLAVDAPQVPGIVEEVLGTRKAETLIVIPGGLGERAGTEDFETRLRERLIEARAEDWRGPLINGGNCLGIKSRPGRYDTMFIPEHKLPAVRGPVAPLAFISQSGAYAVAAASKLAALNPRYLISIGNQTDLTVGDYLSYLKNDREIEVFACYVEGFRPLDGLAWARAASEITQRGGIVLLYRAGRTAAGADASASHTASIAGDYVVTREIARSCGVVVVESLDDFVDLVKLACLLRDKPLDGWGLGALSNAGFECVAFADNLGAFELARLDPATRERLEVLLRRCGIHGIVAPRNPLDVTPMMGDEAFVEAARALFQDPGVDAGIVGCVPLTGALDTLPPDPGHGEDISREGSVVSRLIALGKQSRKPWVAAVDGGPLYDVMAAQLEAGGVPTFRSADRALRLLGTYCGARLAGRKRS